MNEYEEYIKNKVNDLEKLAIVTKDELAIYGGKLEDTKELEIFLSNLNLQKFSYFITETLESIQFNGITNKKQTFPITDIERLRLFGKNGDLFIRKEGSSFHWRFLGKKSIVNLQTVQYLDFWQDTNEKKFFVEEKEALLWGKFDEKLKRIYSPRVARAHLVYPIKNKSSKAVKIIYKTFSSNGVIAFTWFLKVKGVDIK